MIEIQLLKYNMEHTFLTLNNLSMVYCLILSTIMGKIYGSRSLLLGPSEIVNDDLVLCLYPRLLVYKNR
jgi:hypothetical protein